MRPFSLNFELFHIKKTEYFQLFCEPSQKTNKNAVFCDFVPQCNKFTNKTWLVLTVLMRLSVLLRLHPFRRVIDEKPTAAAARERIQPQTYSWNSRCICGSGLMANLNMKPKDVKNLVDGFYNDAGWRSQFIVDFLFWRRVNSAWCVARTVLTCTETGEGIYSHKYAWLSQTALSVGTPSNQLPRSLHALIWR